MLKIYNRDPEFPILLLLTAISYKVVYLQENLKLAKKLKSKLEVNELLGDDKFIENQRCMIPNKEEQVKQ